MSAVDLATMSGVPGVLESVSPRHLETYLEFTIRFNRRKSRRRGLLFYRLTEGAVVTPPLRYETPGKIHGKQRTPPTPPSDPQLRGSP
ncbi:MAG: hypothetical protein ACYDEY_08315 [Acidimicrobiales bacterium]